MPDKLTTEFVEYMMNKLISRQEKINNRDKLVDEKGNPYRGQSEQVQKIDDEISQIDYGLKSEINDWFLEKKDIYIPEPRLPENITLDTNVNIIVSAELYHGKNGIHIRTPMGQIYVVGSSSEPVDQNGFPEVFLAGEFIDQKQSDDTWVLGLLEYPGEIVIKAQQFFSGISTIPNDLANLQIILPIKTIKPMQTVKRAGNRWYNEKGRTEINKVLSRHLEVQINGLLNSNKLHLWTDDTQQVINVLFIAINKILEQWGLTIYLDSSSMVRIYPKNTYRLVLEMISSERLLMDLQDEIGFEELSNRTGFPETLLSRFNLINNKDVTPGIQIFSSICSLTKPQQEKFAEWLLEIKKMSFYSFVSDQYLKPSEDNKMALSEQVIIHALKNPVLCVGEGLEINNEWASHYSILQAELNLLNRQNMN